MKWLADTAAFVACIVLGTRIAIIASSRRRVSFARSRTITKSRRAACPRRLFDAFCIGIGSCRNGTAYAVHPAPLFGARAGNAGSCAKSVATNAIGTESARAISRLDAGCAIVEPWGENENVSRSVVRFRRSVFIWHTDEQGIAR